MSLVTLLLVTLIFTTTTAAAQNLLTNPDLDSLDGWTASGQDFWLNTSDGMPAPPSAVLTEMWETGSGTAWQCVSVSGLPTGTQVSYGGYVKSYSSGCTIITGLSLVFSWYSTEDCVGEALSRSGLYYSQTSGWERLACSVGDVCAPPGKPLEALSFKFSFSNISPALEGCSYGFDGVFVKLDPFLFADGFEAQ